MRRASRQGEATPDPRTPDPGWNAAHGLTNANSNPPHQSLAGDHDVTRRCNGVAEVGNAIPKLCNAVATRGNVITTRGNDVATRRNVVATHGNVLATHGNDVATRGNAIARHGNDVAEVGNGVSMPRKDVATGGNLDFRAGNERFAVGDGFFDERNAGAKRGRQVRQVSTACDSGRVVSTSDTRPLPQAVLT
jgi:hypothetical protein